MKTTNKFLALALMAVAMAFASCSKDDNDPVGPTQQEIETKIIGKWKYVSLNGTPLLTNDRSVATYYSNKTETFSISRNLDHGVYAWENKTQYKWSVEGDMVYNKPVTNVGDTRYEKPVEIDDNYNSHIITKTIDSQGVEHVLNINITAEKVTADYSQDIIGMWEGVEITGYETYGNAEHRILYKADGTYVYLVKSGDDWVPSTNVDNEYNVDGDWLATRWRPEAGADYNYEWWDIDYIKDGTMKWSALREKEDGTRFTTTFTWKKVEMPTQKEIEEKIIGKWKGIKKDGIEQPTNNRRISTFFANGTGTHSRSDFKSAWSWANQEPITYSVVDNTLHELSGKNEKVSSIYSIDDNNLCMTIIKKINNGIEIQDKSTFTYTKVTSDYSQDIIGMWEGVEVTGYETYGNAEHRILYNADGTYVYFVKSGDDWVPSANVDNEYNVDGDWLATRWRPEAGADYNYEWWDIDYIKDGTMKWSALREKEDGTRFTTTFTWKKIN